MPKTNKTFSLELTVCDSLKAKSLADRVSMSDLVEEGLRLRLGMPTIAPEAGSLDLAETRTEKQLLKILQGLPVGWHDSVTLSDLVSCSHPVTQKALKALGRQGAIFHWGDGFNEENDQQERKRVSRWGARDPVTMVDNWGKRWRSGDLSPEAAVAGIEVIRKMLIGASPEIREQCASIVRGNTRRPYEFSELTPSDAFVAKMMADQAEVRAAPALRTPEQLAENARIDRVVAEHMKNVVPDA